jgi:hypothetical protein
MNDATCYRCDAKSPLRFKEETAAYNVPQWECPSCGDLFYDARKYKPVEADGRAYVRVDAATRRTRPYPQRGEDD